MADPDLEQVHFIGKDIITFHTLFWPAMLHFSGRKAPERTCTCTASCTVSGEKMSKSRGTGIDPLKYLSLGHEPEWLRYYIAAKLNAAVEDVDFNPEDFVARVNSDLVGKYINIASRAAGFLSKRFGGQLSADVGVEGRALLDGLRAHRRSRSSQLYEEPRIRPRRCARSWCWPTASTNTWTRTSPGSWPRTKASRRRACSDVCTVCIEAFRLLTDLPEAGAAGAGRNRSRPS